MPYGTRSAELIFVVEEHVWGGDTEGILGEAVINEAEVMVVEPDFLEEYDFRTDILEKITQIAFVSLKTSMWLF